MGDRFGLILVVAGTSLSIFIGIVIGMIDSNHNWTETTNEICTILSKDSIIESIQCQNDLVGYIENRFNKPLS